MKTIKQPKITQKERNKITKYYGYVAKNGYKPWHTIRQSHTYGQGQEMLSRLSDRTHHLYSRGERQMFVLVESLRNVIDLKEQFPLPLDETLALATELNIKHPGAYKERVEHDGVIPAKTMTSDLVATFQQSSGQTYVIVYSFKYADALDERKHPRSAKRFKQKLELERTYWERQGIKWILVTEECFNPIHIYNLEYLRECFFYPEALDVSRDVYQLFLQTLYQHIYDKPSLTLKEILNAVSLELDVPLHQAHCLFQKAAYIGDLNVNLFEEIEIYRPLNMVKGEVQHAA